MITIPKDIFDQIMTTLGCPFVTYAPNSEDVSNYDLELNEDQIKNNLIAPVFKEYFRWFPIEDYTNITVSQNFEIDFPDASTFSVKDVRLSTKTLQYAPTTNPFVNQCFIRNATGSYGYGMYGTRNNYGFTRSQIYRDIEMQSYIDKAKTFKWRVLKNQRKIVGYSNIEGAVEIHHMSVGLHLPGRAIESLCGHVYDPVRLYSPDGPGSRLTIQKIHAMHRVVPRLIHTARGTGPGQPVHVPTLVPEHPDKMATNHSGGSSNQCFHVV